MLVIVRFLAGAGLQSVTPRGERHYYDEDQAALHYVTLHWIHSPRNGGGAARSDSPA